MSWMLGAGIVLAMTAAMAETKFVGSSFEGAGSAGVIVRDASLAFSGQFLPIASEENRSAASVEEQFDQVVNNMLSSLTKAGCSHCVRLNIYAVDDEALSVALSRVSRLFPSDQRPTITTVVTQLSTQGAKLAVDGVGSIPGPEGAPSVNVALAPSTRDLAFVSGMVERGLMAEATTRTLESIERVLAAVGGNRNDIVLVKAFLGPMEEHLAAKNAIRQFFGSQKAPPITLVEWISSIPIEIEVVATLPALNQDVRTSYFNPPGDKVSPVFSRAARVPAGTPKIFTAGLSARSAGDSVEQLTDVFAQLESITKECGSDFQNFAKGTSYVTNAEVSNELRKFRERHYNPARPPAASKVTVAGIGFPQRTIALDMIAAGKP